MTQDKKYATEKMDVVYICRTGENEELRYSLRSVEKNLKCRKVWIVGGKPKWAKPDGFLQINQDGATKWDKVHGTFREICTNPEITENFILFNDDFFVMKPTDEIQPKTRCSLYEHIVTIEMKYNDTPNGYTKLLRQAVRNLKKAGKQTDSYELHIPMIFNKHKLLEILGAFPTGKCTRTLYGNFFDLNGEQQEDVKVYDKDQSFSRESQFLSSDDGSWGTNKELTEYVTGEFQKKSKFEE